MRPFRDAIKIIERKWNNQIILSLPLSLSPAITEYNFFSTRAASFFLPSLSFCVDSGDANRRASYFPRVFCPLSFLRYFAACWLLPRGRATPDESRLRIYCRRARNSSKLDAAVNLLTASRCRCPLNLYIKILLTSENDELLYICI